MKFSEGETPVHVRGHVLDHALDHVHVLAQETEETKHGLETRKDVSVVGPGPQLLGHVPGHTQDPDHAVGKGGEGLVLARPVVFLRTTEVDGRHADAVEHLLQGGGRHPDGEDHRLAEGTC